MDLVSGKAGVRRLAAGAMAAGLVVTVAACGSSAKAKAGLPSSSKAPVAAASVKAAKAVAVPHVNRVIVTESDAHLSLSVSTYKPQSYTFTLKNTGKVKHALTINGPGLVKQTSAAVAPGQTTDLIVPLVKGTYELYSPLVGQKAKGLDTHISVG